SPTEDGGAGLLALAVPGAFSSGEGALASPGAVPALKALMMAPGVPAGTGAPLFQSIATSSMPGAMRKGVGGASFSASFIKSRKIGAATVAPCSFGPKVRGLSKPTYTPAARSGEKPMNQTDCASCEVPVLPASGLSICAPTE